MKLLKIFGIIFLENKNGKGGTLSHMQHQEEKKILDALESVVDICQQQETCESCELRRLGLCKGENNPRQWTLPERV